MCRRHQATGREGVCVCVRDMDTRGQIWNEEISDLKLYPVVHHWLVTVLWQCTLLGGRRGVVTGHMGLGGAELPIHTLMKRILPDL